jgi:hypothetical protein
LGGYSAIESENPGRKEQNRTKDQVRDVTIFFVRPILHDTLHLKACQSCTTSAMPSGFHTGLMKFDGTGLGHPAGTGGGSIVQEA